MDTAATDVKIHTCYHCGSNCDDEIVSFKDKYFCCYGCKTVFEILSENNLCEYYELTQVPGISQRTIKKYPHFEALDNESIRTEYILFSDGSIAATEFSLPQMHCSSCIWLLENLSKLNKSIVSSRVDFPARKVNVVFKEMDIKLSQVAVLLAGIGYEPHLNHNKVKNKKKDHSRIYKIGIAGFAFANIMMLSLPDYFSGGQIGNIVLQKTFIYISFALSIPVLFYCASEFFVSAWVSLKNRFLNIDAPIALAIAVTFIRSVYEIVAGIGPGYLDSMTGIVFFMLIGRWFQDRTYRHLSFDRDYRSYFPISVTLVKDGIESQIPLEEVKPGQRILIRNEEHLCADAVLLKGNASIDYSFVTGESEPVLKRPGEMLYAGGKQIGSTLLMEVVKSVSQSYIMQLWNNPAFDVKADKNISFVHKLSKYFTIIVLLISAIAGLYWMMVDPSRALNAFTAPLIVACPCALLLSATFCNGNIIRLLAKNGLFLKNSGVAEAISKTDAIVFDKTGTLTIQGENEINFYGGVLSENDRVLIKSAVVHSSHPYSKMIKRCLMNERVIESVSFLEYSGKGIECVVGSESIKVGSATFVKNTDDKSSGVYVSINNKVLGYFLGVQQYRQGLNNLITSLSKTHELYVVSGDSEKEKSVLAEIFPDPSKLFFKQSPYDKLAFIERLQAEGKKVMMIGDGLNDAGALVKSNVGIAVSNEINNFIPACDAILKGSQLISLRKMIDFSKAGQMIILGSFVLSFVYNITGLWFAVSGSLQPVIAAILMPASSLTIILFTTGFSGLAGRTFNN
jgi:P-type Cu+ transporter